ncbi:MAG: hypothetical protein U0T73_07125 [Chitinophagales bacterium]
MKNDLKLNILQSKLKSDDVAKVLQFLNHEHADQSTEGLVFEKVLTKIFELISIGDYEQLSLLSKNIRTYCSKQENNVSIVRQEALCDMMDVYNETDLPIKDELALFVFDDYKCVARSVVLFCAGKMEEDNFKHDVLEENVNATITKLKLGDSTKEKILKFNSSQWMMICNDLVRLKVFYKSENSYTLTSKYYFLEKRIESFLGFFEEIISHSALDKHLEKNNKDEYDRAHKKGPSNKRFLRELPMFMAGKAPVKKEAEHKYGPTSFLSQLNKEEAAARKSVDRSEW